MNLKPPSNIKTIEKFIDYHKLHKCEYYLQTQLDKYSFIKKTTWNLYYTKQKKPDKSLILDYLGIITSYEPNYLKKLIKRSIKGKLFKKYYSPRESPNQKYTSTDILLLAQIDMFLKHPNGLSLAKMCNIEGNFFNNSSFNRLKDISKSTIYNLREEPRYKELSLRYTHTQRSKTMIGKREKPEPNNQPGFIRVDSVHYGDNREDKGCFFINLCDEVSQWEVVVCVSSLLEENVIPAIVKALEKFPFKIIQFHSDNGSEYINHHLAELLNSRLIKQTKSRPRHSTDNGLIESKNAHIVRKYFGHFFISAKYADKINIFLDKEFYIFLNFYRVCLFPDKITDDRGKEEIIYTKEKATIPILKLKEIDPKGKHLKEGITYKKLMQDHRLDDLLTFMRRFDTELRALLKIIDY